MGLKQRTFLALQPGEHCIKGFLEVWQVSFWDASFLWPYSESNSSTVLFFVPAADCGPFVGATRPGHFEVHALISLDKRWFVVDVELSVKAFQIALTYLHISFLRENQLTRQRFLSEIGCLSRCNFGLKLRNLPNFGRSDRISIIKNHKLSASNVYNFPTDQI